MFVFQSCVFVFYSVHSVFSYCIVYWFSFSNYSCPLHQFADRCQRPAVNTENPQLKRHVVWGCGHTACCARLLWRCSLTWAEVRSSAELRWGFGRDEGTGEWRKLHNEELNDLYCSPSIVRVIKLRRMRWVWPVAYPGSLFGGGVQQIQLRTERTGIWRR